MLYAAIYKITNKKTGKVYIGETTDATKRYGYHLIDLSKGEHTNKTLQDDFLRQGGMANFSYDIIEKIPAPDNVTLKGLSKQQFVKLKAVLWMREYYHQIKYDNTATYNKKYSLKEIYHNNKFPECESYGRFTHKDFESYDLHILINNNKEIFKKDNANALISDFIWSNKKTIPYKPGCKPEDNIEGESENDDVIQTDLSPVPYYKDYIFEEDDYFPTDSIDKDYKTLNDHICEQVIAMHGKLYSKSFITYRLVEEGYLIKCKGTPAYFPTELALKKGYFIITTGLKKEKVYRQWKVRTTVDGRCFINNLIKTLPTWVVNTPFTTTELEQGRIFTLEKGTLDKFKEHTDILSPCKFRDKYL